MWSSYDGGRRAAGKLAGMDGTQLSSITLGADTDMVAYVHSTDFRRELTTLRQNVGISRHFGV